MGLVHADIQLINGADLIRLEDGTISKEKVRSVFVNMLVDSGAYMMAINQEIKAQLGLKTKSTRTAQLADGQEIEIDIVGPIEVRFANRDCSVNAMVLPGATEPLLGAIPMEEMDVLIHPNRNELIVNPKHPNVASLSLKYLFKIPTL
jgi:clan AA aspartic protease